MRGGSRGNKCTLSHYLERYLIFDIYLHSNGDDLGLYSKLKVDLVCKRWWLYVSEWYSKQYLLILPTVHSYLLSEPDLCTRAMSTTSHSLLQFKWLGGYITTGFYQVDEDTKQSMLDKSNAIKQTLRESVSNLILYLLDQGMEYDYRSIGFNRLTSIGIWGQIKPYLEDTRYIMELNKNTITTVSLGKNILIDHGQEGGGGGGNNTTNNTNQIDNELDIITSVANLLNSMPCLIDLSIQCSLQWGNPHKDRFSDLLFKQDAEGLSNRLARLELADFHHPQLYGRLQNCKKLNNLKFNYDCIFLDESNNPSTQFKDYLIGLFESTHPITELSCTLSQEVSLIISSFTSLTHLHIVVEFNFSEMNIVYPKQLLHLKVKSTHFRIDRLAKAISNYDTPHLHTLKLEGPFEDRQSLSYLFNRGLPDTLYTIYLYNPSLEFWENLAKPLIHNYPKNLSNIVIRTDLLYFDYIKDVKTVSSIWDFISLFLIQNQIIQSLTIHNNHIMMPKQTPKKDQILPLLPIYDIYYRSYEKIQIFHFNRKQIYNNNNSEDNNDSDNGSGGKDKDGDDMINQLIKRNKTSNYCVMM